MSIGRLGEEMASSSSLCVCECAFARSQSWSRLPAPHPHCLDSHLSQKKRQEQIVPFCVSVVAGRRYSAITSRNIEKKQANPKWQAERLQEKTRRNGGKGEEGRRGGVGWVRHGSCRGFRCARPKIRQEMRREDGKKENYLPRLKWDATITQAWDDERGKLEEKEGYKERKGAKSGGGKVENVTYRKFLRVTFQV